MVLAAERRSMDRLDAARGCASMGLLGVPSVIGNVVVWLASDAASYVTGEIITGDRPGHDAQLHRARSTKQVPFHSNVACFFFNSG